MAGGQIEIREDGPREEWNWVPDLNDRRGVKKCGGGNYKGPGPKKLGEESVTIGGKRQKKLERKGSQRSDSAED